MQIWVTKTIRIY